MSTNALVGVIIDDKILSIYNHYDGYPAYLLHVLQLSYNTKEKAMELISMGNASFIGETLEKSRFYHKHYNEPLIVNRGFVWNYPPPHESEQKYMFMSRCEVGFKYLFDDGWKIIS